MKQIVSDIAVISINKNNYQELERILCNNYGSIIRWAIVDIIDNKLKICFSYEKGV